MIPFIFNYASSLISAEFNRAKLKDFLENYAQIYGSQLKQNDRPL